MKRSFSDVDNDAEARARPAPANGFNPKRRKQYGTGKHKAKEGSLEYSRKRARNIERLLRRKRDLPANVQHDLQRELESHKSTVSDKSFLKKRSAMISKYHMVRFFERKKASRLAMQIKRKMEQNPGAHDVEDLKRQLHIAEVDEAYTIYHPHMEPYISLYGSSKSDDNDKGEDAAGEGSQAKQTPAAKASLSDERPPMWSVVEKTMEEGVEALKRLRERRCTVGSGPASRKHHPSTSSSSKKTDVRQEARKPSEQQSRPGGKDQASKQKGDQPQLNRRERRRLMREAVSATQSDEDDDGGFFEGM
ncbi:rRNA-processing protein EFG1 [Metarhizium album ARSEF 1941]|uniref:rRNA-processing protein EFG1 n=1 Tax=Metarhizium album (strain ARSEF 1941) TaxID=1081103 RepID=A0A0B2WQC9_METAS|nr:rRNA-processing protein EFG1 [Metarhizium album ARSEF 1941]KHN96228.1 rRNA-processing protein EFG1 [Metarhizium album ARSEF 1941]